MPTQSRRSQIRLIRLRHVQAMIREFYFYRAFGVTLPESKKMFSSAERASSNIECSTPDAKGQTEECKDKGVTNYPTWYFQTPACKQAK